MTNRKKTFCLLLLAAFLLLSAVSCSQSGRAVMDADDETPQMSLSKSTAVEYGGSVSEQKLICRGALTLETLDFDSGVERIGALTGSVGGYLSDSKIGGTSKSRNYSTRTAAFTARVPADRLDEYLAAFSGDFNVLSTEKSTEDVTETYYDVEARLNSLKKQEERVLAMIDEAVDLGYLLELTDKLAEIQADIDVLTSKINRMDKDIAYSTVTLTLYEVGQLTPEQKESFGARLADAFVTSWQDFAEGCGSFAVFLVSALPTLLVLAVLIFLTVLLIRALKKKNKKRTVSYAPHVGPTAPGSGTNAGGPGTGARQ